MKWDLDLERGILQGVRKGEEGFKGGFLGVRKKKKTCEGEFRAGDSKAEFREGNSKTGYRNNG